MPPPVGPMLNGVDSAAWYAGPQGELTTTMANAATNTSNAPGTASWGKNLRNFGWEAFAAMGNDFLGGSIFGGQIQAIEIK